MKPLTFSPGRPSVPVSPGSPWSPCGVQIRYVFIVSNALLFNELPLKH